jgi:hypothetical protein
VGELFELMRQIWCDGISGSDGADYQAVDEWSADETSNRHNTDFLVRN